MTAIRSYAFIVFLAVVGALNAYDALTLTHWVLNAALAGACFAIVAVRLVSRRNRS